MHKKKKLVFITLQIIALCLTYSLILQKVMLLVSLPLATLLLLGGLNVLGSPFIYKKQWVYDFLYWLTLSNLGFIYSYIPTKVFALAEQFTFILSPWILSLIGSVFVGWGIWWFLRMEIQRAFAVNALCRKKEKRLFVFATVLLLFVHASS